jgi:hypothetical protein
VAQQISESRHTSAPSIELDGRQFFRHNGCWFDSKTFMKLPSVMEVQLNALARRDPEGWELCLSQDVTDGVRGRSVAGSARRHPARLSAGFDWQFGGEDHHDVIIRCNLQEGWRMATKRWRFGASALVDLPKENSIRINVTVFENLWYAQRYLMSAPENAVTQPVITHGFARCSVSLVPEHRPQ